MEVVDAIDRVQQSVASLDSDYTDHGFGKVEEAYNYLTQAATADTEHDWSGTMSNLRQKLDELEEDVAKAEEEEAARQAELFERELQESLDRVSTAVNNLNSLIEKYNTVSRFAAETVGPQDPQQFDWSYFERDLGSMESLFADTFEGSGQPSRAAFAYAMADAHYKQQAEEAARSVAPGSADTQTW